MSKKFCTTCGKILKMEINPVPHFKLERETYWGCYIGPNSDGEADLFIIDKSKMKMSDQPLFNIETGEKMFNKIYYCKNGHISWVEDSGTYKELTKKTKTTQEGGIVIIPGFGK